MDKSTGTDRGSTVLSGEKEYTLDSIIEDYTTYGYLENDQVRWLLATLKEIANCEICCENETLQKLRNLQKYSNSKRFV